MLRHTRGRQHPITRIPNTYEPAPARGLSRSLVSLLLSRVDRYASRPSAAVFRRHPGRSVDHREHRGGIPGPVGNEHASDDELHATASQHRTISPDCAGRSFSMTRTRSGNRRRRVHLRQALKLAGRPGEDLAIGAGPAPVLHILLSRDQITGLSDRPARLRRSGAPVIGVIRWPILWLILWARTCGDHRGFRRRWNQPTAGASRPVPDGQENQIMTAEARSAAAPPDQARSQDAVAYPLGRAGAVSIPAAATVHRRERALTRCAMTRWSLTW